MAFDIKRLMFFVNICEKRSMTAAARLSNVTQPVLSYHVAELEKSVGEPLLIRRPDGVEPTEAGLALLIHARAIISAVDAAERAMRTRRSQPGGLVSVGLLASISPTVAPRLIQECKRRYPLIQIKISEGTSLQLRNGVDSNEFDLAVNLRERGNITSLSLLVEDLYFIAKRGLIDFRRDTIALPEALQHRLILPPQGHVVRALVDEAAAELRLTVLTEVEIEGLATIKSLVAAAIGPAILGFGAIKAEYESGIFAAAKIVRPAIQRELILDEATKCHHPKAAEKVKGAIFDVMRSLER